MAKISKINGSAAKKLKKGKKRRHEMKDEDHANDKSRLKMKKKRLENDEENGEEESGEDWQAMEEMGMESGSEGEQEEEADIDEAGNDDEFISGKEYKTNIQKLKDKDPEFYKFLQENEADILNFEGEQSDEEEAGSEQESDEDEMEEEEGSEEGTSRAPKLRKDPSSGRLIVDDALLEYLEENLEDPSAQIDLSDVRLAIDVFTACTARVGADIEPPEYVIDEQPIFDGCVRLCFRSIGPILCKLMGKQDDDDEASVTSKRRFKKYSPLVKQFLQNLLLFVSEVQSEKVIVSALHTISPLVGLFAKFTKLAKRLVKVLVRIWTRKTLNCRIVATLVMSKLAKNHSQHFSNLFKSCYLGFVSNSRDVNNDSLPLLQFMQRSFAEITLLAPERSYPYAFVYIRQIAIHLRNAMIGKRTDLVQTVYNWQLVQCLYLWVRVISKAHFVSGAEALNELAYPLTQIIVGVSNLCQSSRFLPLRLHCASLLIQLQANCAIFVPTLDLTCDILDDVIRIVAKKPNIKAISKKKETTILPTEINLETMLKCGSTQMEQIDWRNAVCDYLFRIFMQAVHITCSQAAFPDLIFPIAHRLQHSIRRLKSPRFSQRMKSLLQKLNEHAKWVRNEISQKQICIDDDLQVLAIRSVLNHPDSPFRAFYRQWEKVWKLQMGEQTSFNAKGESKGETKEKQSKNRKGLNQKKKNDTIKVEVEEKLKMTPNGKKQLIEQKESSKKKKKLKKQVAEPAGDAEDMILDINSWFEEDE